MPGTHPQSRARLEDVALLAGVSPATASRVLTGSAQVKPETRRQVEQAIAQLGYVRNRAARAAARRAGSIAVVVGEESLRMFSDPFFARLMHGVTNELGPTDLQLVLLSVHSTRECRRCARYLRAGRGKRQLPRRYWCFSGRSLYPPSISCGVTAPALSSSRFLTRIKRDECVV